MPGNYSHTTRSDGTTLTATIYNGDHQNHITNMTPAGVDDYQVSLGEKQTQTNPSSGLATALAGDLAQLRYVLNLQGAGTTYWYEVGGPSSVVHFRDLAVAAVGTKKDAAVVARPGTITKVLAYSDVSPTVTDLIFDVNKNGTSIWNATQANRVKVVVGANAGNQTVFDTASLAEGDRLEFDIDQIGTVPGGNASRLAILVKPLAP